VRRDSHENSVFDVASTAVTDERRLSSAEEDMFDVFLTTAKEMQRRVDFEMGRQIDIALTEYQALRHLAGVPGHRMRLQDLAAARGLSPSRTTRIIDKLESRGLVEREKPDDDQRGWFAVVTEAGRDWLDGAEPAFAASVRHALGSLDRRSIDTLTAIVHRHPEPAAVRRPSSPEPCATRT
jgi:DNA-binding MarR family transcriptional regulator